VADHQGQRTEKPTQRRLERARREGNFPSSREFLSAIQFLAVAALAALFGGQFFVRLVRFTRRMLTWAFRAHVSQASLVEAARGVIALELAPLLVSGAALVLLAVFAQLASTRMGVSLKKLAPDIKRLSPLSRLKNLPGQNLPVFGQALLLLPLMAAVVYYETAENLRGYLELPWMAAPAAAARVSRSIQTLLWRAAGLFLLVGVADLVWQRRRYLKQLRMSKQEIREELKEQEGNPQIKARVRRIQRDLARRQMMKEVPKATAVIVNPTHYAVAIRYLLPAPGETGSAPKVVAKGKNYLAARIRKLAMEHQVPVVENPPLARALYQAADVGQEIPSQLYRAVAEILAYIYRLMNGRLPG
jgi:flagellar biosynthetic protein FlhB